MIRGSEDFAIPEKGFLKACKLYKTSPVTIEGMGHNLMIEPEYKLVVDKIIDWILSL